MENKLYMFEKQAIYEWKTSYIWLRNGLYTTDNQVVEYWSLLGQWTGKNPISFDLKSNEKRLKKYIHFEQKVPENFPLSLNLFSLKEK